MFVTEWNYSLPRLIHGGRSVRTSTFGASSIHWGCSGRADISFGRSGRSKCTCIPIRTGRELTLGHVYDRESAPAGFPLPSPAGANDPRGAPCCNRGLSFSGGFPFRKANETGQRSTLARFSFVAENSPGDHRPAGSTPATPRNPSSTRSAAAHPCAPAPGAAATNTPRDPPAESPKPRPTARSK